MSTKAIHIVQRMAPGGIETLVLDLLASRSTGDCVYSLEGETGELADNWPALEPYRSRLVGFGHREGVSWRLLSALTRRLRQDQPSAVILHHIGPYLYGGLAARLAGIPVLVHVEHDSWHLTGERRRRLTRVLERLIGPRHIAVSSSIAATLSDIVPGIAVRVVPNGVDLGRFSQGDRLAARRMLDLPADVTVVGSAGRLMPVKGHDVLVRAARALGRDVHVVIAGSGESAAALAGLAETLGIADRVHLVGHRDDIECVLPAFDLFCLPSRNEGLPRSVIEAQACGVPVVASDVGGLADAVCPRSGRLVVADDVEALAGAIEKSLLERHARPSPRAFVEARFAWRETLAAYERSMELSHAA